MNKQILFAAAMAAMLNVSAQELMDAQDAFVSDYKQEAEYDTEAVD